MTSLKIINQPAELSATTAASVAPTLGFPNDRVEESQFPVGWRGLSTENLTNVSRETFSKDGS